MHSFLALLREILNVRPEEPQISSTPIVVLPDGRVKHVHALAHTTQDAFGDREFVGAVTNITEQRRFIEREGGNQVMQHVLLLCTPNAGSPWPTVEDWALRALSLGLNGLSALVWPAKLLGSLLSAIEKIDVTLDEMHPNSEFLKTYGQLRSGCEVYDCCRTSLVAATEAEPLGRLARLLASSHERRFTPRRR